VHSAAASTLLVSFGCCALWCSAGRDCRPGHHALPDAGGASQFVQSTTSAASARTSAPYKPGTIVCGAKSCEVGREACCASGDDEQVCAPLEQLPPDAHFMSDRWPECDRAGLQGSPDKLSLCDDSGDCPGDKVCCSNWLTSGSSASLCVSAKRNGDNACDFFERCADGQPCRTMGTECAQGRCELRGATVRCGGRRCDARTEVCCERGEKLGCSAEADCQPDEHDPVRSYHCTGSSGCPRGSHCVAHVFDARCQGVIDASESYLCETDGDCPGEVCTGIPGQHGKPRCRPWGPHGMMSCECG
jgi:hypothetical protein